jgi:hypothetical protein
MALGALSGSVAVSQQGNRPPNSVGIPTRGPTNAGISTTNPSDPALMSMPSMDLMVDPDLRDAARRREAARKLDRKKRMVDSANRLLELTQQLRVELQNREAGAADSKRLDEIAKLARTVKDQMRE